MLRRARSAASRPGSASTLARLVRGHRWQPAWWATLVVVTALGALWALASPLFSVPDEPAHVIRAAAAARGQLLPGERTERGYSTWVEVPEVFAQASGVPTCFAFHPDVTAGCAPSFDGSDRPTLVETNAGLYPPAFYAVVGLPSVPFPSTTGVYLMRVVSAAICGALLASALASARLVTAPRLVIAGVAAAVTPQVLFLAGSVNPNGVEIAAAISLWTSLAVLLTSDVEQRDHGTGRLFARVAIAGAVLALSRPGSPLWVGLTVGTVVLWAGFRPAVALLRDRRTLAVVTVVGAATASTVAWVSRFGTLDHTLGAPAPAGSGPRDHIRHVLGDTDRLIDEMIGTFGWLDTGPATPSVYLWLLTIGGFLILALASTGRRRTAVLVALVAAVVLVPVILQVPRAATQGFPWQGRYTLPLAVGVPIVAALQVDQSRLLFDRLTRRLGLTVLVLLAVGQLAAHVVSTRRYTTGAGGALNWLAADGWVPPVPAWALLVGFAAVLTIAVLGLQRLAEEHPAAVHIKVSPPQERTTADVVLRRPATSAAAPALAGAAERTGAAVTTGTGER